MPELRGLVPAYSSQRESLQLPTFSVLAAKELFSFWGVRNLQVHGVPVDSFSTTISHVTQQDRFGNRAGVIEVAGRQAASLAGGNPLLVMAGRFGNGRIRALEVGEL